MPEKVIDGTGLQKVVNLEAAVLRTGGQIVPARVKRDLQKEWLKLLAESFSLRCSESRRFPLSGLRHWVQP